MRYTKKALRLVLGGAVLFALLLTEAQAVPAFARQTGMACASCHYQNFPALNSFGRVFRSQGYTMRGAAPLVEGEELSIPADLKASVITKIRYQLSEGNDGGRGEIQWPDEAALLVGGRASERVGFLLELGMGPQEAEVSWDADADGDGTITPAERDAFIDAGHATGDVTGNFLSAKFHFNLGNSFAIIPFSTDGLGVGYGFELMNTGVQRSQRPIENRSGFSAHQALGLGSGGATGLAFVYHNANVFVNYSHWAPTWGNVNANIFGGLAHYLRAAYMPNIGGWDTGIGFSYMDGSIDTGATDAEKETTNVSGWGIDAQAQGQVGSIPLGIYASYAVAPKGTADDPEFYNASTTEDKVSYGMTAKLGVLPSKVQLYAAYGSVDDGTDTNTDTTVGVQYMAAQNIKLELFNVARNNNRDGYSMLMMFAGF